MIQRLKASGLTSGESDQDFSNSLVCKPNAHASTNPKKVP